MLLHKEAYLIIYYQLLPTTNELFIDTLYALPVIKFIKPLTEFWAFFLSNV